MAELLCCTVEFPISAKMLQASGKDLVVGIAPTIPEGSYDMDATGSTDGTLLAETEDTSRLAGETICRHA